jgi:hypothetical protein
MGAQATPHLLLQLLPSGRTAAAAAAAAVACSS